MKQIFERRGTIRSLILALVSLAVALVLFGGTASAGKDDNPGKPFAQIEAKLDAIEAKLDDAGSPIPQDGTVARDLSRLRVYGSFVESQPYQQTCFPGPCTCTLDGFQASCALVFACLDAGLCELDP